MKKVLMIAYFYPPSAAAGTFRSLRFSRYLFDEGWKAIILTVKQNKFKGTSTDYNLLGELPASAEVYRTSAFLFYNVYARVFKKLKKLFAPLKNNKKEGSVSVGANNTLAGNTDNVKNNYKYFFRDLLRVPDEAVGWMPFAFIRGLLLIYKKDIDIIYASGSPFSSFITGKWLKKITGKPLVVDFRDPWAGNYGFNWSHPCFERLALSLERMVLNNADKVIANTPVIKQQFISNHKGIDEKKIIVINNGFDVEDFKDLQDYNYRKFTIAYIGAVNFTHNPKSFLLGLRELLDENSEWGKTIQIMFVGSGFDKYLRMVEELELGKVVKWCAQKSHVDALNIMNSAHVLLLLLTVPFSNSTYIPGKTFEYFASGKPILAITSSGALKDLCLEENVSGEIIEPDSISTIKDAIKKMYQQYQAGELQKQPEILLEKYNAQYLTKQLANALTNIVFS